MGNFSFNGTFTGLDDPHDYTPYRIPERGQFLGNGKPIRQGYESGTFSWPAGMNTAQYNELRSRWEANKNTLTSGAVPAISGYGWRAVSAWWHEPIYTGMDGPIVHGVTMGVTRIANI